MSPARSDGGLQVEVSGGEDWPEGSTTAAVKAAHAAYRAAGLDAAETAPTAVELSLLLSDDAAVRALNRGWRGKDKATNVLAFPAGAPEVLGAPLLLGDVVLARETVMREAREQDKPVEAHLMHLVVHGVLHLLGFDHETEAEAKAMEAAEVAILGRLGIPDPYATAGATAPAAE